RRKGLPCAHHATSHPRPGEEARYWYSDTPAPAGSTDRHRQNGIASCPKASSSAPLLPLLVLVVACLTQRLERTIPELGFVTTMRLDVVTDQERCIVANPAAQLAGEAIAHEDRPTQLLPTAGFVPG